MIRATRLRPTCVPLEMASSFDHFSEIYFDHIG
jgi:hypothetical protein